MIFPSSPLLFVVFGDSSCYTSGLFISTLTLQNLTSPSKIYF